jgi:hypothetical protein
MAFDFPTSPTTGQEYLTENGRLYLYDGSGWTTLGNWQTPNRYASNLFKYRTIYTRGYVAGGYQNSSPWQNVNRTQHSTDITTNLGDIMDLAAAYTDAGYSDYYMYIYATSASWPGTGTRTSSINMTSETSRTYNSVWDLKSPAGGYGDVGVILNSNLSMAWILSDQTNIDKHNYATEIMYAAGRGGSAGTPGDYVTAWYGETYGWVKHGGAPGGAGSRNHKIEFATETWSAAGLTVGTDGWGKALKTKEGYAYVKNGGNTTASAYKINDLTGANIRTDLSFNNSGEENYETGQNWGYCVGEYNGAQNNNTYKVTHGTDTYTVLGSASQPKGHGGISSAAMATASSQVLGGL